MEKDRQDRHFFHPLEKALKIAREIIDERRREGKTSNIVLKDHAGKTRVYEQVLKQR